MESYWSLITTVVGEWFNNYFPIILLWTIAAGFFLISWMLWKLVQESRDRFITKAVWMNRVHGIISDWQVIELLNHIDINSDKNKDLIRTLQKQIRTELGLVIFANFLENHNYIDYDGGHPEKD